MSDLLDPPDLQEARRWYQQAAEAGNTWAATKLGDLLSDLLDPPDLQEARRWYQQAAEAADTWAATKLGGLLSDLLDPPDLNEACRWYQQADEAGNKWADCGLGAVLAKQGDVEGASRSWQQATKDARGEDPAAAGAALALATPGRLGL